MSDDTTKTAKVVPIRRPTQAAALMGNPAGAAQIAEQFEQLEEEPGNPVDDIDGFMAHLVKWQKFHLGRLRYMTTIPVGNEVEITDDKTGETKKLVLEGDVLEGFKLGLRMGISEFKELPFAAETEEEAPVGDTRPMDEKINEVIANQGEFPLIDKPSEPSGD